MKELHVITDLQYGSTGKGLYAGWLASQIDADTVITAWGPNAGHTYIDKDGKKYVHTMLANAAVIDSVKTIMVGPGSVINPDSLMDELGKCGRFGKFDFWIHEHAAVVRAEHRAREEAYGGRIGSTMKGVGEAVIEKIRRDPAGAIVAKDALKHSPLGNHVISRAEWDRFIDNADKVMIEGAQGFSLGINSGFYPYTTSRECTTFQVLSDCAVPRGYYSLKVHGVCRTLPIRVNNRTGFSGPNYPDQQEIGWSDVGLEPELTTVTKLPRRLFTFSLQQIKDACRMNGVDYIFLNFCNYLTEEHLHDLLEQIEAHIQPVSTLGFGPRVTDIRFPADLLPLGA